MTINKTDGAGLGVPGPATSNELGTFSRALLTFGIGSSIGLGAGYFVRILLARALGPGQLAILTYAISLTTIGWPLATLGLDLALPQYVGQVREDQVYFADAAVRRASIMTIFSSLLASAVVLCIGLVIASRAHLAKETFGPLLVMALGLPFTAQALVLGSGLLAYRRPIDALLAKTLITRFLRIGLLALLLGVHALTALAAAVCFVIGDATSAGFGFVRFANSLRRGIPAEATRKASRALSASAKLLMPGDLIGQLQANYAVPLLIITVSPAQAGIFAGAYAVATLIKAIPFVAGQAILPSAAHTYRRGLLDETRNLYRFSARWTAYALGPILVALFVFSAPVTRLALGPGFEGAGNIVRILSLGMVWDATFIGCGPLLLAVDKTRSYLTTRIFSTLAAVALSALLIPSLGGIGAGIGLSIGIALETTTRSAVLWRTARLQPFSSQQARYLLLLAGGSVALWVTTRGGQRGADSILALAVFVAYCVAAALFVILHNAEDSAAFRKGLSALGLGHHLG